MEWRCSICGYVYDPNLGDPDSDVRPGTYFEYLPLDWICPECGAGKEVFETIDEDFEDEEFVPRNLL
jgi:rubredoxin